MSFLISDALAQAGPEAPSDPLMQFLPLIAIFVIFYFLLIRPQSKRAKEHKALVAALSKGDEVVTNGGLVGRVSEIGDDFVTVEIAAGTQVHIQRSAVASVLPKGTIKSL